jgi:hypothetical protein
MVGWAGRGYRLCYECGAPPEVVAIKAVFADGTEGLISVDDLLDQLKAPDG